MSKPFHKFRMDNQHRMFLDDKPLKCVQAMQLTMDARNQNLAILNLVMIVTPPELEHGNVEVTVEQPTPEPPIPDKPEEKPGNGYVTTGNIPEDTVAMQYRPKVDLGDAKPEGPTGQDRSSL